MGRRYDVRGRPPRRMLTPELAREILDRLRQGQSKASIARELDLPTATLYSWLRHHPTGLASEQERERARAREQFQREAKRATKKGLMVNWERTVRKNSITAQTILDYQERVDAETRRRLLGE